MCIYIYIYIYIERERERERERDRETEEGKISVQTTTTLSVMQNLSSKKQLKNKKEKLIRPYKVDDRNIKMYGQKAGKHGLQMAFASN